MITTAPMLSPVLSGHALVEHVPGIQAEPGTDEHGQGNAVHGEADEELGESASHH